MIQKIKQWRAAWRKKRASIVRNSLKRSILMDDMREFFEGKKTEEESLSFRGYAYAVIDAMTDDEVLDWDCVPAMNRLGGKE